MLPGRPAYSALKLGSNSQFSSLVGFVFLGAFASIVSLSGGGVRFAKTGSGSKLTRLL